jgi:hypothetical protein
MALTVTRIGNSKTALGLDNATGTRITHIHQTAHAAAGLVRIFLVLRLDGIPVDDLDLHIIWSFVDRCDTTRHRDHDCAPYD